MNRYNTLEKVLKHREDCKKSDRTNPERARNRRGRWYVKNREYFREYRKKWRLRKAEELAGRPKPQICEIYGCQRSRRIHFDHSHKTNGFRGWICQNCNLILGQAHDNPELLRSLANYLEEHS